MGSVCGGMDKRDREYIAKAFAELTALLEDGAALAVDGQSKNQLIEQNSLRLGQLRFLLKAGLEKLDTIASHIEASR